MERIEDVKRFGLALVAALCVVAAPGFVGAQTIVSGNTSCPVAPVVAINHGQLCILIPSNTVYVWTGSWTQILTGFLGSATTNNAGLGTGLTSLTTGTQNIAVGTNALQSATTGYSNVAIGLNALRSATTGFKNVAIGPTSLQALTTGQTNIAIGDSGMVNCTTCQNSVGIGQNALSGVTTGSSLTALGVDTLVNTTSATNSTAIGALALNVNTTGSGNTAVGVEAGYTETHANGNTTGGNNTWIGYQSGPGSAAQIIGSIALGYRAHPAGSNSAAIGTSALTQTDLYGGVVVHGATGGSKGNGTINAAGAYFANGSQVIDSTGLLSASIAGGHGLGASTTTVGFQLGGTLGPTTQNGFYVSYTMAPAAGNDSYSTHLLPAINKAASGTHADFVTLLLDAPTIGAGAATLTNASTLKITGAPAAGTNQRAVWVAGGGIAVGASVADLGTGTINAATAYYLNGTIGASKTYNVRAAGGVADCTIIVTGGLATGGTC